MLGLVALGLLLAPCSGLLPRGLAASPRAPAARFERRSVQMNLFDRFTRVAKANLNNILQNMEDPEKVLTQAVEDIQKDLVAIRQSYAEVMATQKRMQRQQAQADGLADEWFKRAQLALEAGDDELAREALTRKQQQVDASLVLADQIALQTQSLSKLYDGMSALESKINEARATKDNYIARARTAKSQTKVNDMLSAVTGGTSMDAFERMKEKVEMLETQAEVAGQLTAGAATPSMEAKFKQLEMGSAVDDELSRMKRQLSPGESSPEKSLPAPSSAAVDDEMAKLKQQVQDDKKD
ncbi:PspA/IM30 family-domain-containing protein [Pelagophyceae sp. CCMP2097]|nr:PspA/IM30 family-domain-containing protein [Pelagophyceae sp. CCMP2097]